MLIIVYTIAKPQGKIRKISPAILLSVEEYQDPCYLQGKDMLLALSHHLHALICILILLLRTSRHRTSARFTCVFNAQSTTFSGVHFYPPEIVVF